MTSKFFAKVSSMDNRLTTITTKNMSGFNYHGATKTQPPQAILVDFHLNFSITPPLLVLVKSLGYLIDLVKNYIL